MWVWPELLWVRTGSVVGGLAKKDNGWNFYQGNKNLNKDYLTTVNTTLFLIK
jgi:hypothetical protein